MEVGCKSRWWARCNHTCDNFGLCELLHLRENFNNEGIAILGIKYNRNVLEKTFCGYNQGVWQDMVEE